MGAVRTILSGDALYYYYKPEYLNYVADKYRYEIIYLYFIHKIRGSSMGEWLGCSLAVLGTDGSSSLKISQA